MTSELTSQITVGLLLSSLVGVLAVGIFATVLTTIYLRRKRLARTESVFAIDPVSANEVPRLSIFENDCRWVAIKSSRVSAVQAALCLHNPTPCSWGEGLARLPNRKLFVAPPVRGWILVVGQGLPDPSEDIDRCFHFLTKLSRSLGQVQYFSVNRSLNHHAWVRVDRGQVRRAYAWAGDTLWNQGLITQPEIDLGLKCFEYGQSAGTAASQTVADQRASNSEKILPLAARWSFDPTSIGESALRVGLGVAGDLIEFRQH
jgi:hypothetical protein